MAKSLIVSYLLWFFGGLFGLHHLYLGRDLHALLWVTTFGGYGLGWMREIWRLPKYVTHANNERLYSEKMEKKRRAGVQPTVSLLRFFGSLFAGWTYSVLTSWLLPEHSPKLIFAVCTPAAASLGVSIVGNVGHQRGPFLKPAIAAILVNLLAFLYGGSSPYEPHWVSMVVSLWVFHRYSSFSSSESKRMGTAKRLCIYALISGLYLSSCVIGTLDSVHVETKQGERVKLRDALRNFFQSPAWKNLLQTIQELLGIIWEEGWSSTYWALVNRTDVLGETRSYRVLGLSPDCTDEELRRAHRDLSRTWHPDRNKGREEEVQATFIEIQEAYELLSTIRASRKRTDF